MPKFDWDTAEELKRVWTDRLVMAKADKPESIRFTAEPGVYVFEVKDTHKAPESNFQDSYQLTIEEGE